MPNIILEGKTIFVTGCAGFIGSNVIVPDYFLIWYNLLETKQLIKSFIKKMT